ncbi:DUF7503 family protein [Halorarius halobius]|nr:hypothetical protein [Halorarius halobius]
MSDDNTLAAYLAENPKMTGVLFTIMLLLSHAGSAVAGHGSDIAGP